MFSSRIFKEKTPIKLSLTSSLMTLLIDIIIMSLMTLCYLMISFTSRVRNGASLTLDSISGGGEGGAKIMNDEDLIA